MQYVEKYGDFTRAEAWAEQNIFSADLPPVRFEIDGKGSDALTWTKTVSPKQTVTDYPDSAPAQREIRTVTFTCKEYPIAVAIEVTSYPGFPVVEYEPTVVNLSDGVSAEIKDLSSVDGTVFAGAEKMTVWYYTGSCPDGSVDYVERAVVFDAAKAGADNALTIGATNGKPTSQYLPDMNSEATDGSGVITVLSWQGNWKSRIALDGDGFRWTAGQDFTDFNLLGKETHRLPAVVLIYYKGGRLFGQNIYRRWFYKHNFMRRNGRKMGTNILVGTGYMLDEKLIDVQSSAKADTLALQKAKAYGFTDEVDRICQDAGWNVFKGESIWYATMGNWEEDTERYPNGLREISDLARSVGLGYTLWVEPERVRAGSEFANSHPDCILYRREELPGGWRHADFPSTVTSMDGLVNLGDPKACDLVIDLVDGILRRSGADSYRQDFNIYPARHWETHDVDEGDRLGIKRFGRTEEQYCNGYLRLFDTLIERHPELMIDACASGGMRCDLASARRSYCHTRTDFFGTAEKAQSDTYVTSQWMVYWGTSFDTSSRYAMRSRIAADVGIGIMAAPDSFDYKGYFDDLLPNVAEWKTLSSYLYEDYYPLTGYLDMNGEGVLAMEYDCPSEKKGMVVCFLRGEGHEGTLRLLGLDENADYRLTDHDTGDVRTVSGRELAERGIPYGKLTRENTTVRNENGIPVASKLYLYEKAD